MPLNDVSCPYGNLIIGDFEVCRQLIPVFYKPAILCSPNEDFGPSKNMWVRAFVSTFHTHKYSIWAKSDENFLQNVLPTYFSTFQNLRLGSIHFTNFMLPKRRFWTVEQNVAYAFLNKFSISCSPKWILKPLKSTSKEHTQLFVQPSKIFVWGA